MFRSSTVEPADRPSVQHDEHMEVLVLAAIVSRGDKGSLDENVKLAKRYVEKLRGIQ